MVTEIATAPATGVALAVIALGLLAWWLRDQLVWLTGWLRGPARAAAGDFGFEWLNRRVIGLTQGVATGLRVTQTGQLNWNVVGIVGGLAIVLAFLAWGA
jgi:hypothetical protein